MRHCGSAREEDRLKEVLEQVVVDDRLQHRGFFTRHDIRFKPDSRRPDHVAGDDRVPSDVDVIGINPTA